MTRPKIGFLPAFFTLLTIAFCIALWLRIRSYSTDEPRGRHALIERSADATSAPAIAPSSPAVNDPVVAASDEPRARVQQPKKARRAEAIRVELTQPIPAQAAATNAKPMQHQPAAAAPPPKPSLLSRLVTPIVNAISGGSHASASPASSNVASISSSASPPHGGTGGTTDTTGTVDKSSDVTPPQLVAIAFNPAQVHDGEETMLTVQAMDDLSGIRSISGTIIAPSNAVQGFALQREIETNNYVAHIAVPKDAAEGVWRVNYLSLIDNASNATTLSGAQGAMPPTATFRVISSRSDSTGPTLKAVWLDKPAMRAGEKNTVFVDASDDQSGVNLVSGVFLSPAKHARIGFACRPGSGPWECQISAPTCIDCGDWRLEQLQLQDKANNMTTVRADNPLVGGVVLNIAGDSCDSTPPSLTALALDRPGVSNVEDSVIVVTATASDDACGVMSISGQASAPTGGARLYFSFTPTEGQMWSGRLTVPKFAAKGVWRVTWIQVLDQGHNLRTYSLGDPVLANAAFSVQ